METGSPAAESPSPSTRPSGAGDIGSPQGQCPRAEQASGDLMVWVEEARKVGGAGRVESTYKKLTGAKVTLNNGEKSQDTREGLAYFHALPPKRYQVSVSLDGLREYDGAQIQPSQSECDLEAGKSARIVIYVIPEVTTLIVRVVDQAGAPIRNESFKVVVPALGARTDTDGSGSKEFAVNPDTEYRDISVELTDLQKQKYAVTQRGSATVKRGRTEEVQVKLAVSSTVIRYLVWDGAVKTGGTASQSLPPQARPRAARSNVWDPKVAILEVSRYFAPGTDYLSVKVEVTNPSEVQALLLRIVNRKNQPVYEEILNADQVAGLWETDPFPAQKPPAKPQPTEDPALANAWAQPDHSPYTVSVLAATDAAAFAGCRWDGIATSFAPAPAAAVRATSGAGIGQNQSAVLFESLQLKFGEWAPKKTVDDLTAHAARAAVPAGGSADPQIQQFVQYKLNALGFFAGPVLGGAEAEWKRAVVRYRQSYRELYRRSFVRTADFATRADYERPPDYPAGWEKIDQPFLDHLKAQPLAPADYKAKTLDTDVIADPSLVKELNIDADRYIVGQFNGREFDSEDPATAETRKSAADNAWLTRPALPILATATLRTRENSEVPAYCPFKVKWDWKDVRWDQTSKWGDLPTFTAAQPSLTKEYLTEVESRITGLGYAAHENGDAPRNAPATAGGALRPTRGENLTDLFAQWGGPANPCQYAPDNPAPGGATKVVTTAYVGRKDEGPLHAAAVFFRPSHIAGDTYQILAQFDLPVAVRQLHADLLGAGHPPVASTGRIENWRRVRVAAYLTWGAGINPVVDWNKVREKFAPAYVKVLDPVVTKKIAAQAADPNGLDISASFQSDLDGLVSNKDVNYCTAWRWKKPVGAAGATPGFSQDSVYPNDDPWSRYDEARFLNDVVFALLEEYCRGLKPAGDAVTDDLEWLLDQWALIGGAPAAASAYFKPKITGLAAAADKLIEPFYPAGYARAAAAFTPGELAQQAANMVNLLFRVPAVLEQGAGPMGQRQAGPVKPYKPGDPVAGHLDRVKRIVGTYKFPDQYYYHPSFLQAMDLLRKRVDAHAKDKGSAWEPLDREDVLAAVKDWKQITVRAQELNIRFSTDYQNTMSDYLDAAVRGIQTHQCTAGMILVHFNPVDARKFDAPVQTQSQATVNGVVFLDAGMTSGAGAVDLTFLVAHELGHAIFLKHWKNTSDHNDLDHDQNDQNCILSYSSSNPTCPNQYIRDQYDPHFCGKCVLKLRGWNIRAAGLLPERTTNPSQRGKEPCSECTKAAGGPCKYLTIVKLLDAWGRPVNGGTCQVTQGATVHSKPVVDGQAAFYDLAGDWNVSFPTLQPADWRKAP